MHAGIITCERFCVILHLHALCIADLVLVKYIICITNTHNITITAFDSSKQSDFTEVNNKYE